MRIISKIMNAWSSPQRKTEKTNPSSQPIGEQNSFHNDDNRAQKAIGLEPQGLTSSLSNRTVTEPKPSNFESKENFEKAFLKYCNLKYKDYFDIVTDDKSGRRWAITHRTPELEPGMYMGDYYVGQSILVPEWVEQ